MNKQEFLNKKYQILCQQLGDAYLKKEQLEELIQSIKTQITTLDKSFNIIGEFESLKQTELKVAQEPSNE